MCQEKKTYKDVDRGFHLDVYHDFLTQDYAKKVYDYLLHYIPWPKPLTNGKRVNINYGDKGVGYTLVINGYSIPRVLTCWDDDKQSYVNTLLRTLRDVVSQTIESKLDYVVVQNYPTGSAIIKPHRDKEMEPGTCIAGLSLGAKRLLKLTHIRTETSTQIELPSGCLYVLRPPTNDLWLHSIEPDFTCKEGRISLTYRLSELKKNEVGEE